MRRFLIVLLLLLASCATVHDISPHEAANLLGHVAVLDVRTPEEFATGYIEGAININYYDSDFAEQVSHLDKSQKYLVYCGSGKRSANATQIMKGQGFITYNLLGGIKAWKDGGYPCVGNDSLLYCNQPS